MAAGFRAILLVAGLTACAHGVPYRGPVPTRNQHPAQLTVLQMDAASAGVLPAGEVSARLDAAYSSMFLGGTGSSNSFSMDGEILRTGLKTRVGLGRNLELGAELAFGHTTGGVLDGFLIGWHDALLLPDQDRDTAPRNRFRVEAFRQGQLAYELREESARLMDLPLSLTWNILPPEIDSFGLAVRGAVELPIGDEERGFGNGEIDYALGLLGEWRTSWAAFTGFAQHTFAGTPDLAEAAGLEFGDVSALGLGAEVPLGADVAALLQLQWETSALRNLDFDRVSREQLILWLGGRVRLGSDLYLEFAAGEDLIGFVSPDFSAWIGLAWLP